MKRRRAHGATIAAYVLAIAGSARSLARQDQPPPVDDGPVIVGEHVGEYNWWDLRRFTSEAEFLLQYSRDSQKNAGHTIKSSELLLRGTTNVEFESYIGHKNLIDLVGRFNIGYEDDAFKTTEPSGDQHSSAFLGLFDVSALILQEGPAPVTVYARRDESLQNRDFNSTLRTTTAEYGAVVEYRSDLLPSRLQYFHRDQTQRDPLRLSDQTTTQDSVNLQSVWRIAEGSQLSLVYTFDHIEESQPAFNFNNTYDRHDATLTHEQQFGDESQHNLRSSLRVYEQSGVFDQRTIRLDELLHLQHTDRLESQYTLALQDQTSGGADQQQIDGSALVRHRLFDSLVSTATAGARGFQSPGEFSTVDVFLNGSLEYTKQVPLGRLDATLGVGYDHQDNSERGSNQFVIDEAHTFNDPFNVILNQRNIVPGSIIVTNLAQVPFNEGVDYTVKVFPDRVELVRNQFGTILNGQAVLVRYTIGPEPSSSIDTIGENFSIRYTINEGFLSGLSVYALYRQSDHSISARDPGQFVLEDLRDVKLGAEYRIDDFRFLGEWERHDSNVSAYDQLRFEAGYERRIDRETAVSVLFTRDEIDYSDRKDRIELNLLTARYEQGFGSGLFTSVYVQLRDQQDTQTGHVQGVEGVIDVHWTWRQTKIFASIRNAYLEGDNTQRLSQVFSVGLTRSF